MGQIGVHSEINVQIGLSGMVLFASHFNLQLLVSPREIIY